MWTYLSGNSQFCGLWRRVEVQLLTTFLGSTMPPSSRWRWQHGPWKRWHRTTSLYGVTTPRTTNCIFIAMETSSLGCSFGHPTPLCELVRSALLGACAYCISIFVGMLCLWLPTYEQYSNYLAHCQSVCVIKSLSRLLSRSSDETGCTFFFYASQDKKKNLFCIRHNINTFIGAIWYHTLNEY